MKHQQSRVDISTNKKPRVDHKYEKFTWKVENFISRFKKTEKLWSEPFVLGRYGWRIMMCSQDEYLSIYLQVKQYANSISEGWCRKLKLRFTVYNQFDDKMSITEEAIAELDEYEKDWGFPNFMPLADLDNPQNGFIVKDVCVIGVEVSDLKVINEKKVSPASGLTAPLKFKSLARHAEVEVPKLGPESCQGRNPETFPLVSIDPTKHTDVELFSASIGELMDFGGVGQIEIEKAFVPLLEEVCTRHPSLIECQLKRTPKFIGWAFNALGRVLYFLKTKKVKDVNNQCCKDLQTLWEELKIFGFDLTWLEPHVQSTFGMESYVEKAMQIEKLKAKLVAAEKNLHAKRELLKSKGFQVRDLDAELGY